VNVIDLLSLEIVPSSATIGIGQTFAFTALFDIADPSQMLVRRTIR